MPELPEVETIRRLLASELIGSRIEGVEAPVPKTLHGWEPPAFHSAVTGAVIRDVRRRGKYLVFALETQSAAQYDPPETILWDLVIHLKMRGSLRIEPRYEPPQPYLCTALMLEDQRVLRHYDMWRWGLWALTPQGGAGSVIPGFAALGPEPFDPRFSAEYLRERLHNRRVAIKSLLLSQEIVAGLGNVYCDECLHAAHLHPSRSARSLNIGECGRLHQAIVRILTAAVTQGSAYADALAARHADVEDFDLVYTPQIYDRPGQPCPECGHSLIKFILHGRGTTLCPNCQPDADSPNSQEFRI